MRPRTRTTYLARLPERFAAPPALGRRTAAWLCPIALAAGAVAANSSGPAPLVRYSFDAPDDPAPNLGSLGSAADGDIGGSGWQFSASPGVNALTLGSSSYVAPIGDEDRFDLADGDFSLHARVRCSPASGTAPHTIVTKRETNGRGFHLALAPATGKALFEVGGSQLASVDSASRIDDGQWHDVLAVRSGAMLSIYVDGALEAQTPIGAIGGTANSRALRIGRNSGGANTTGFTGEIDDVSIYDRAVTPVDVGGGLDCNHNGIADSVEISSGAGADCDGDGLLDECEGGAVMNDCNANGLCDAQELALGLAPDVDQNGTPDDCQSWNELPYGFDRMVVFGDSLSDPGNMHTLTGHPASPPNYQGRFSNGRVWCEQLAGYLGLPPALVANFAFGGAASGDTNSLDHLAPGLPGLADEIELYRQLVQAGHAPTPDTLFVVWIGPNDFNAAQFAGSGLQLDSLVHTAMDNIEDALRDLAQLGARTVMVPNMPDLGSTPLVRWNPDPQMSANARIATIGFNSNLAYLLRDLEAELGIDFVYVDVFDTFDRILADPASFGFDDVLNPCLDPLTQTPCLSAATRLFWDELHPTTAGHRRLALDARAALESGGAALPEAPCLAAQCLRGTVEFTSPAGGMFTSSSSVTVTGKVALTGRRPAAPTLRINGADVAYNAKGDFRVDVPLVPGQVEQPIVATLLVGDDVLDRDRLVLFQGPSLTTQTTVQDAVVAYLSRDGIGVLSDELMGRLLQSGALDIRQHLLSNGWIASDFGGEFQYTVTATNAGFVCSSIDLLPMNGRLFVRVSLHDLFIDYAVHAWFDNLPDPGFDCDGRVTASRFSVFTELAFHPTNGPAGEIDVEQLLPLDFELLSFQHTGSCAGYADFANALPGIDFSVEQAIRNALRNKLGYLTSEGVLATTLETVVRELSVSAPLSSGLGVAVSGDISGIQIAPTHVRIEFDARIQGAGPIAAQTYAAPQHQLVNTPLNAVTGGPSSFKLSIALRSLNQLMLAKSSEMLDGVTLEQLDLGAGPQWLTAGVLSALVPSLSQLGSSTAMQLRVRPTLPPMLLEQEGGAGLLTNLYVGQVLIEFVPLSGAYAGQSVLTFALDARGDVALGFDAQRSELVGALVVDPGEVSASVIANPLGARESDLQLLFGSLRTRLVSELGLVDVRLSMPSLDGVALSIEDVWTESGYATAALELDSVHARPDLIVEWIDPLGSVDILSPFTVSGRVRNIGSQTAWGGAWLGASLSLDGVLQPWDLALSPQQWLTFGNGLAPGQSRSFSLPLNAVPQAVQTQQTLFVLVDMPFLPGGTGAICERSETNNALGVGVLTTVPDAFVQSVTPPSDLIGGGGSRPYRVSVGRNGVGPAVLSVPVRVSIGNPEVAHGTAWVDLERDAVVELDVFVPTPASFGSAGDVNHFELRACSELQFDSNWSNNCAFGTASIAVPWWDLRFQIVNAPSSADRCDRIDWSVKVTNVGNVSSMNVCAITGITLFSGAQNWGSTLGILNFVTPNIPAGGSWTFHVNDYFVSCGAFTTTQYIKSEINYASGCFDNYSAGNFAQKSIAIH